jgi:chaperonin GroES
MFRPLQNKVLIRPVEAEEVTEGGIIIPDAAKEKPSRGEVVAAGPGKVLRDGTVVEMSVKEGDVVLFGKYSTLSEIKVGGEVLHIVAEENIFGVER